MVVNSNKTYIIGNWIFYIKRRTHIYLCAIDMEPNQHIDTKIFYTITSLPTSIFIQPFLISII